MNEERIKNTLIEKLCANIDSIISGIDKLESSSHSPTELDMIKLYKDYLKNFRASIRSPDDLNIFRAIAIIGNLTSEIDRVEEASILSLQQLSAPSSSNSKSSSSQFNFTHIKNTLKNTASYLWQLLAQITNLSQWSVSGNAGGNFLGLSGSVTIQITFEK